MRSAILALGFFFGVITITPSTIAIVVGLTAPLVSYLVAARRFSGKIETTEARDLWAESKAIRDWSQQRIDTLNGVVERLEARVELLEEENDALRAELHGKVDR